MFREMRQLPRYAIVYLHKCILCKWQSGVSYRQMLSISSLQSSLGSITRSRKLVLGLVLLFLLILYFGPHFLGFKSTKIKTDLSEVCLDEKLSTYQLAVDRFDVGINHSPIEEGEAPLLAYVGNGKIATAFGTGRGIFIRLNRALSQEVPFNPVVESTTPAGVAKEAFVVDYHEASAQRLQALHWARGCITMGSRLYAHRTRPSILVQSLRLHNPTAMRITFNLKQEGVQKWPRVETTSHKVQGRVEIVQYTVSAGILQLTDYPDKFVMVAIATVYPSQSVSVKPGASVTLRFHTVVHHTEFLTQSEADAKKQDIRQSVIKEMEFVLKMDPMLLRDEHATAWHKLWRSGFSISLSKAATALNGDKINSTLYYVLSNVPAPLHDVSTTHEQKLEIRKVLFYPNGCYGAYSTLHADKLWLDAHNEHDVASIVTTWIITLETHGCENMIKSGAEGVLQAMLLSLGALQFKQDHLEFLMEPQDLHRDMFFHRINYGNNTHLNISVEVGDDNRAVMYVALDRNDKPYYGCDAGCNDPPVALSNVKQSFPVKLTKPITALLYITADTQHMEKLKHAIHTKENNEAPPHEHHVIALHKHGHHFGGLPTIFWVSIVFLILIFHMFLFKLIYNEYCSAQDRYTRGKYNL
ncbi:uncharacterized protein KIAA2013 homolog [Liolophura sinensis]|uniref:uncharacterized protein KIAA2013 homolog n=1 Tax=Liolophura sinensis TaxID=3198878 RepID=UPI00315927A4